MSEDQETAPKETGAPEEDNPSTITDLTVALKEIEKLRKENAAKRVKSNEIAEKATKWEEYVQSQKTELEKLAESNTSLTRENETLRLTHLKEKIATEEKVPSNLVKFLDGADEAELRANAKELASAPGPQTTATNVDFFSGQRGAPVTPEAEGLNGWFNELWRESEEKSGKTKFTS